jgi:hypothetical protein
MVCCDDEKGVPVNSKTITEEIHPLLEAKIKEWSDVSSIQWHQTHLTLRTLRDSNM